MAKIKDITGKRFGKWTVIEFSHINKSGGSMWLCKCDCGTTRCVDGRSLRVNTSTCCGCERSNDLHRAAVANGRTHKSDRLYAVWRGIKERCRNESNKAYALYGGKGIDICEEWANSYEAFRDWAYDNGYNPNAKKYECTIDRIDNTLDYSPDNCRWVNMVVQCNNRSSNHRLELQGEERTISEWSRITGLNKHTIRSRIEHGWTVERALTEQNHHAKHTTDLA